MRKRQTISILAVLTAITAFFVGRHLLSGEPAAPAARVAAMPGLAPSLAEAPSLAAARDQAPPAAGDIPAGEAEVIAHLRAEYGDGIENPYIQIRMIEKLMRYYQARYPDTWQEKLLAALRAAFPERYQELAAMLEGRLAYEAWMDENQARLQALSSKERYEALWETRKRLFGDAAERIWASELKNQALVSALETLDVQDGTSLADKLTMYRDSLEGIYQEGFDAHMQNHRQEAMDRFLDLSTVQQSLSAMAPAERKQSLRQIRETMGMDEEALARWDALDDTRDARWEAGMQYMAERATLAAQHQGTALEEQLGALRQRYFGTEADIIASEEAAGFFRFERERRWGRN